MPFEKGKSGNPNGRGKGTPNKSTTAVREVIARFADEVAPDFVQWVKETAADGDPAKAADLYLKAIEYHIPKLSRTEQQALDENGQPTNFNVVINVPDQN